VWKPDTYSHTHSDFDTHRYANAYTDFHAQTDADAEVTANTKASSYSAAPAIAPDSQEISDGL